MKFVTQNPTLSVAIGVSVLAHGLLLAVRFAPPDTFRFKPADPGLEVILVNAKHDRAPLKAEALAQANLDGGGNAASGRSKSPLPNLNRINDGDSLKAMQRRIEELEEKQRMLAQLNKKASFSASNSNVLKPSEAQTRQNGIDAAESMREILRREAEIHKRIEDENKRPKKTFISPSTREVGYAVYFDKVKQRIEKIGTANFPQKDGKKLYGELTLSISIFQNGHIYEKDSGRGISIDRSSGNRVLDEEAVRIVRRAAPFGAFPKNMRSAGRDDVWVMTTRFTFTRDGELETEWRGEEQ